MQNCVNDNWNLIRVLNKPLPFKGKINGWHTDDYATVMKCLIAAPGNSIVIDDSNYLITNAFMRGHSSGGSGSAVFDLYNKIADDFWNLIQFIVTRVPEHKIVYMMMHEETNDFGVTKPKTIGKLLDDKVCVEGMFTIVLRCIEESGKHLFVTQASQGAVSKSPIGMFEDTVIPNDLAMVDKTIRDYYEITIPEKEEKQEVKKNETAE